MTPTSTDYTVRRFRPEDAPGVLALLRKVYGDTYTVPALYHPEKLIELNRKDLLVSIVALDGSGQIVGHYDLDRTGDGDHIAEATDAMVMPEHRHHHLLERMRVLLEEEARRLGLRGLFGETVTNHLFAQRAVEHYGVKPCGIILGAEPQSFHNLPEPLPQRMSEVLYFKYLHRPERAAVHLPERHHQIGARVYDQFELEVEQRPASPAAGTGRVSVSFLPEEQWGVIRVERVGADSAAEVRRLWRELCDQKKAEVVYLELPLSQPGMPEVCADAEEAGFFFSGIGPYFLPDGDALRLQFLNVELDIGLLQIENSFAKELAAYVEAERRRVARQ